MSSDTPSWLQTGNEAPPTAPPAGNSSLHTSGGEVGGGGTLNTNYGVTPVDNQDDKELPGVILTMRLANMGVATAIIAVSVRTLMWRR
jgi:hypothetical protein